jgi:hypothetical protein
MSTSNYEHSRPERWLRRARALGLNELSVAVAAWCVAFFVVLEQVLAGQVKDIPYDVYVAAAQRWLAHQALYDTSTIDGFQYFPQSALLFVPFTWLGVTGASVAWRALWWGLYAFGIWRVATLLAPRRRRLAFLIATGLSLGPAVGSLANGQANLALGALTLHVAADLSARRWWRATALLALGLALKPLMAVLLLLVWVLYRPMAWRLPLALLLVVLAPLLVNDAAYLMSQYATCVTKLGMTSTPDRLFEDLRGLLASLGWWMPHPVFLAARALAALGVLWLCWRARRQLPGPEAAVLTAALAVGYLMLFNPRTLSSSYVMTGSLAGVFAAVYLFERQRALLLVMACSSLSWTLNRHWHGFAFIRYWLQPCACLAFLAVFAREALVPRQRLPAAPSRFTKT